MPKYIIERDIPNAGDLSAQELQAISQKSCGILSDMWTARWEDLIDFEITPVVTSVEAAAVVAPRL